jgi:tetratricopeptide (TPR) repeat protein
MVLISLMATIIINLKDIIIDPDSTVDLAALPAGDAIDRIKKSYGFLASSVDVSITDGTAVISLNEPPAQKGDDAVKTYSKAVQDAQQGDYAQAIKRFEKVLASLPLHIDARRNLAMAYLEMGNAGKALEHLKECIQLDPQNVWSYLLLGNIYAQQHKNYDVAEFYFQKGLSISPTDNILLNNYAVLKIGRQQFKEAQSLFEKALASDPAYPNTYVGLARLHQSQGNAERALKLLQTLFAQPKSQDRRSAPMYQQAWNLFVEINREVAEKSCDELIATISDHKKEIEERTGFPVSIVEDDSLDFLSGQVQMAWKHNRKDHLIRYRKKQPATTPHLIAHEIEHILLEDAARKRGRNLFFTTTEKSREHALRSLEDHTRKLQKQGYDQDISKQLALQLTSGLCGQLFNCPIDMMVEYSVYKKYDALRPSQIVSLNQIYQEALSVFNNTEIRKVAPPSYIVPV